jgi:hypothetical protein
MEGADNPLRSSTSDQNSKSPALYAASGFLLLATMQSLARSHRTTTTETQAKRALSAQWSGQNSNLETGDDLARKMFGAKLGSHV